MAFTQAIIGQIQSEHLAAPRGAKTIVVERWADFLGCSEKKIWAVLKTGRKRKKDDAKAKELEAVTEAVFKVKLRVPDGVTPITTDQAYQIALDNGEISSEATLYSASSIDRKGRELKLGKKTRRIQRFQAEYPNQMHHVDASTSQFFYVAKALPDGDYILKLHSPSQNYKNKPTPLHQRLWIYGIVDDYSGCAYAEYTVAPGESLADNMNFLERAWRFTDDKTFCGLPEKIKADKGPMMRGKPTEELFKRLRVKIDPSVPGAKDAHGKIERPWRTHWQRFEKPFLAVDDWKNYEITLSELNRRLSIYLKEDYNQRPHRYEKEFTRDQMWRRINLYGGIRTLPEGAFSTAAEKHERKVKRDGTFSLHGKTYEVKGLHDAKVYVLISVFTGKMTVEDIETGEKYEVIDFKPNPIGKFTAHPDTPYQKIKKAGKDLHITDSIFQEEKEEINVVPIPTRLQEEQLFENVFDTGSYASLKDAMGDFSSIAGIYPEAGSEDRATLEQLFIENKLRKSFVRNLADDCIRQHEQENRRYGNV